MKQSALCLSVVLMGAVRCLSCDIPVFQYALSNWVPADYEAVVFYRGVLSDTDRQLLATLEAVCKTGQATLLAPDAEVSGNGNKANCMLHKVDLDKAHPPEVIELWSRQEQAELPWLAIYYPMVFRVPRVLWAGKLNAQIVSQLANSGIREKIALALSKGDTIPWVLIESGDNDKDDRAATLLERQLTSLEKTLIVGQNSLAEAGENAPLPGYEDFQIRFSLFRLSRSSPGEALFIQMLLHSELDLPNYREPLAFPIYGRGRALYALVGRGITENNIREACEFLLGPCSCLIKDENPGVDILIQAAWDDLLDESLSGGAELHSLASLSEIVQGSDGSASLSQAPQDDVSGKSGGVLIRNLVIALAVVFAVTISIALAVRRKVSQ